MQIRKADIIAALQTDILRLQGFKPSNNAAVDLGLRGLAQSFPNETFPLGAIHEFLSPQLEDAAATSGFLAGLLSPMMRNKGTCLWIGASRKLFPPALKSFGIQPERFIFIDVQKEKHALWAMDES